MEADINAIYSEMMSVDDLHAKYSGCDIGTIISVLFENSGEVKTIYSYKEGDYDGTAFVVYCYKGIYFYLMEYFGSCDGCDDWESYGTYEGFRQDIKNNIVDNIYDITLPLEEYVHQDLRTGWEYILRQHGSDAFDKCVELANKRIKEREDKWKLRYAQEEADRMERERKEKEEIRNKRKKYDIEVISDLKDVITYLETNDPNTDPYYSVKYAHQIKMLRFYMTKIDGVSSEWTDVVNDLKARGLKIQDIKE